ncbi:SH3 domain-containing protein [Frigoriglobus tundricola]|uniref:SH3b domain-containing protein n=1 Tax=Frigoriglobus tundricola TaxID=2774151 RepID=A0A6M5YZ91_9BACT|nr:SH3 domain-containing protein [Frigoriglobus tundricola]QJW98543.1 hypothetical protein FTUN_6138 [Frigoriglobus tundricola]
MRPAALVVLAALLFVPAAGAAEPVAYRAIVTEEVKLRSGPSSTFEESGTLAKGTAVIVEGEEGNGWLAVTAPAGSVSWVSALFIEDPTPDKPTPKNVFVHADDEITLAAGRAGLAQPLDIRRSKVPNGTVLLVIGPKTKFAEKFWYPVVPPAGDVRYLPKSAVQNEKPVANFTVRVTESTGALPPPASVPPAGEPLPTVAGPGSSPAPVGSVVASKPAVNHPLWTQAEAAEREGRYPDAEKAYFDLAALMNGTGGDHDVANLCYTRIHALREKKRNSGTTTSATSGVLQPPAREDRGVRPGPPQVLPSAANANTTAPTSGDGPRWTGPGVLRRSPVTPDGTGKPCYALESAPGAPKAYVTAGPGVDLEKMLGKRVDVYGAPQTRNGLSRPYVVATAVEAAP